MLNLDKHLCSFSGFVIFLYIELKLSRNVFWSMMIMLGLI